MKPKVLIVMGSDSDLPVMEESARLLDEFGIPFDMTVASAHRSPERLLRVLKEAEATGVDAVIAGAGMAAHLAGVIASHTVLPVIGVPINSSPLQGVDSVLSMLQMPSGVPVATMAIGKAGARNAAVFAAQILGRKDPKMTKKLRKFKDDMASDVENRAGKLKKKI